MSDWESRWNNAGCRGPRIYVGAAGQRYHAENGELYPYESCPCCERGLGFYIVGCPVPSHSFYAEKEAAYARVRRDESRLTKQLDKLAEKAAKAEEKRLEKERREAEAAKMRAKGEAFLRRIEAMG